MATVDRLRLYSDDYPEIPRKLLRDINRMFDTRDETIAALTSRVETLETSQAAQDAQIASILSRLAAAGIP